MKKEKNSHICDINNLLNGELIIKKKKKKFDLVKCYKILQNKKHKKKLWLQCFYLDF